MRWDSRLATAAPAGSSGLWLALKRGFRNRCPLCGEGRIFNGYLTVVPECAHCGCKVIGHGVEAGNDIYCCAHCAQSVGVEGIHDRV